MALLQRVEDTAMPSEESGCDCFSFFSFRPDSNSAFCSDNTTPLIIFLLSITSALNTD